MSHDFSCHKSLPQMGSFDLFPTWMTLCEPVTALTNHRVATQLYKSASSLAITASDGSLATSSHTLWANSGSACRLCVIPVSMAEELGRGPVPSPFEKLTTFSACCASETVSAAAALLYLSDSCWLLSRAVSPIVRPDGVAKFLPRRGPGRVFCQKNKRWANFILQDANYKTYTRLQLAAQPTQATKIHSLMDICESR